MKRILYLLILIVSLGSCGVSNTSQTTKKIKCDYTVTEDIEVRFYGKVLNKGDCAKVYYFNLKNPNTTIYIDLKFTELKVDVPTEYITNEVIEQQRKTLRKEIPQRIKKDSLFTTNQIAKLDSIKKDMKTFRNNFIEEYSYPIYISGANHIKTKNKDYNYYFTFINLDENRDIKYLNLELHPYNAVNDLSSDIAKLQIVGPISNDSIEIREWDLLWDRDVVDYVKIKEIKIEYMNGETEILNSDQILDMFLHSADIKNAYDTYRQDVSNIVNNFHQQIDTHNFDVLVGNYISYNMVHYLKFAPKLINKSSEVLKELYNSTPYSYYPRMNNILQYQNIKELEKQMQRAN